MKGSVSILDFKIQGYSDDPDILAKAQLNIDGQDYEVLVVAAAAPATTKKYIPDVIDLEQEGDLKRMLVVFNGDRLSEELDRAITQAKAELDELDDEDNYAAHVGTAGASVITLWLNRSMEAAKTHIRNG
jgi:hypothetical protein